MNVLLMVPKWESHFSSLELETANEAAAFAYVIGQGRDSERPTARGILSPTRHAVLHVFPITIRNEPHYILESS
jgi:hypothetical protein